MAASHACGGLFMQFHILGAHRETGENIDVVIEAADRADAVRIALSMNALISQVQQMGPGPDLDEVAAAQAEIESLNNRLRWAKYETAPDYRWLNLLGRSYCRAGVLTMALGVVGALLIFVYTLANNDADSGALQSFGGMLTGVLLGLGGFILGAAFLASGQMLLAFRDMARNSWTLPTMARLLADVRR